MILLYEHNVVVLNFEQLWEDSQVENERLRERLRGTNEELAKCKDQLENAFQVVSARTVGPGRVSRFLLPNCSARSYRVQSRYLNSVPSYERGDSIFELGGEPRSFAYALPVP